MPAATPLAQPVNQRKTDPTNSLDPLVARVLTFDGAGDFIEVPSRNQLVLKDWTVETWVNLDASEAADGAVLVRIDGESLRILPFLAPSRATVYR